MVQFKRILIIITAVLTTYGANGASIVATVNGNPISDADITARTKLMARQGNTSTNNRHQALENIISDSVKLEHATMMNSLPSDVDVEKELNEMNVSDFSSVEKAVAKSAIRASMAWQMTVGRTIMPNIEITDEDIKDERISLIAERGLPIETTLVRLLDIPNDVAKKLKKPTSCDNAIKMAEDLGGAPQKITALQYELSPDIRERIADLPKLTWSARENESVLLVCSDKKTKDYGDLDNIIEQNAKFKKAINAGEQQLKQLRRKAIVIIHDDKYKI